MEEREGFFTAIWKAFTEGRPGIGPTLVVVPNEIERPSEKAPSEGEEDTQPAKNADTPAPH